MSGASPDRSAMASIDTRERASFGLRAVARPEPATIRDLLLVGLTIASERLTRSPSSGWTRSSARS
jgi:hypothetical protein